MPRLILQFENRILKECPLGSDATIGRLPDNTLVIDNPAVSGHHARIFLEGDRYVVEDLRSKNGTYVNERHVIRQALRSGDVLLVGKHQLVFDETAVAGTTATGPVLPTLGETAYLDTKKHRALLARLREERARERARTQPPATSPTMAVCDPPHGDGARLRVIAGRADRLEYPLDDRTLFIGKSEVALIRLGGWFTPKAIAAIVPSGLGYDVTPMSRRVSLNGVRLSSTQALVSGDVLEVGRLVLRFEAPERSSRPVPLDAGGSRPGDAPPGEECVA